MSETPVTVPFVSFRPMERELDADLARMQLTEGLAGGGRNREKARARVNRLMREVDKCIALAEQPFDASSAPETRTAE